MDMVAMMAGAKLWDNSRQVSRVKRFRKARLIAYM